MQATTWESICLLGTWTLRVRACRCLLAELPNPRLILRGLSQQTCAVEGPLESTGTS